MERKQGSGARAWARAACWAGLGCPFLLVSQAGSPRWERMSPGDLVPSPVSSGGQSTQPSGETTRGRLPGHVRTAPTPGDGFLLMTARYGFEVHEEAPRRVICLLNWAEDRGGTGRDQDLSCITETDGVCAWPGMASSRSWVGGPWVRDGQGRLRARTDSQGHLVRRAAQMQGLAFC